MPAGLAKIPRMTKSLRAVAILALAFIGIGSCTPKDPKFAFTYAEKRGVLEANGLRFVIVPDSSTELVEVDVRYAVGSKEDPEGKAGLAHVMEHLMFQLRPDEGGPALMHYINQLSTGFNAFTNWDSTHYMTSGRAENLDAMLKIEAMRLFYGCKTIPEDEFLREREVVRNEIRQRGGTAEGQIPQLVMSAVYPKGHAYERMIGGDDKQLSTMSLQDACDFAEKYYVPERATVIIAGGVDYDKTVDMIEKWFGKLERKKGGELKKVDPVKVEPGKVQHDLDIERNMVAVAWALPASNTPEGEYVNYGLNQAFFRTASKADEYDFAYSVQPVQLGGTEAPVFAMLIELKGMDKMGEALEFVKKATASAHRGFTDVTWQQFDNQRKRAKASYIEQLEYLQARTGALGELVQFDKEVQFDSNEEYVLHALDKYDRFDGAAIASSIKKNLDYDKAKIIVFKANKEGIKGDVRSTVKFETKSHDKTEVLEVDPKEAKQPLQVSAELKSLSGAERYTLGNGMKVVLLPREGGMPIVAAQLIFDVGVNQAETPGAAELAAGFLNPPMDAEKMFAAGVGVNGRATNDHTIFSSSAINIYLDIVINGLERTIKAGYYDQDQIEGWQKGTREYYATEAAQAELEYERQFKGALYGADHPYAKRTIVLPENIGSLGKDDLTAFARKHYTAGNATLVLAGNFDAKKAKGYISDAFGGWSKGTVDQPIGTELRERTGPEFIGVVGKEGPQMQVGIAYPAAAGIDGEEGARRVLTQMLDLELGDVRSKLGSTYALFPVSRSTQIGPGAYIVSLTVDAARGGESLKALRDGIDKLRVGGQDFDIAFVRARRMLVQQMLGESTVSAQVAGSLGFIDRYDLEPGYFNTLLKTIAVAPVALIKSLIERELDAKSEIVVLQADRATLEATFKDAGITDFRIVEPEYK